MYLTNAGYKVDVAISGRDALRLLDVHHYDVIVTDLVMVDGDGAEVISTVRRKGGNTPIIAMRPAGILSRSRTIRKWPRDWGASAFISKPFELSGLKAAIEDVLKAPAQ